MAQPDGRWGCLLQLPLVSVEAQSPGLLLLHVRRRFHAISEHARCIFDHGGMSLKCRIAGTDKRAIKIVQIGIGLIDK